MFQGRSPPGSNPGLGRDKFLSKNTLYSFEHLLGNFQADTLERTHFAGNCGFSTSYVIKNKSTTSEQIQKESVTWTYIQPFPGREAKSEPCLSPVPPRTLGSRKPVSVDECLLFHVHSICDEKSIFLVFPYMPRPNGATSTVNAPDCQLMVHVCTLRGEGRGHGKQWQVTSHPIQSWYR